jgi:hypothetical protein
MSASAEEVLERLSTKIPARGLNRIRVEAFSGIAEELYELLVKGQVQAYRNWAYDLRDTYPTAPRPRCGVPSPSATTAP